MKPAAAFGWMTALATLSIGCAPAKRESQVASRAPRSYFMGFSVVPPKPGEDNPRFRSLNVKNLRVFKLFLKEFLNFLFDV